MKKRILSLILAMTMLFACFPITASASTNGHTRAEAVKWARDRNGTAIKYYSSPATLECMDLAGAYYAYLGHPVSGLGCPNYIIENRFYNNTYVGDKASTAQGWNMYTNTTAPKPGDLVLWKNSGVGHIGIILSVGTDSFEYIDYNYNGSHCGGNIWTKSGLYNFDRIIRPDFPEDQINPLNLGENFYAYIECDCNWSYLTDVDYNVTTLTPPEFAAEPSYDPRQIWHFVRQSNGAYKITNEYSGHCMDASNFGTANGTNVGICQSNDSAAQRWYVIAGSDGYGYSICPQYATNLRLDKNGGGRTAGNIQLYQNNNSTAQNYYIYKLSDFEDYSALKNYSKPAKPAAPTVFGEQDGVGAIVFCDDVPLVNSKFDNRQYNFFVYKGTSATGTPVLTKTATEGTVFLIDELEEGTYTAEVRAVNTKYQSYWSSGTATFTVVAGPSITTTSLPSAEQYKDYSAQVSAQGKGTLQWSIKSGCLPAGLSLDAATGKISGKPTAFGSFPFTVTVSDTNGTTGKTFTLSVAENKAPVSTKNLEIGYIDATHIALQFCIQNDTDNNISASIMTAEYAENGAFVGIHSEGKTIQSGENAVSLNIALSDQQHTAKVMLLDSASYAPLTSDLSVNDWILASDLPDGAEIFDEKWTYTLTETDTSYQASMPGWVNTGSSWQQVGNTSTRYYATYPAGFDTNHTLYSKYEKASLSPQSWSEDNAEYKTDVVSTTQQSYIYWHWTWNNAWRSGDNYNVFVAAKYGWDEESQRTHTYFSAFESTTAYGYTDPKGVSGLDTLGRRELDCYYAWFGNVADGSWWWYRFPVYKQTYADFIKEYTFERVTRDIESQTEVLPGNGISNVQHWVKYKLD